MVDVDEAGLMKRAFSKAKGKTQSGLKLLVLDTAWTLEAVRERRLEHSITCRDLGGFFSHVWSVHPFATLLTSEAWGARYGHPSDYALNQSHTVIEGKVGRFAALKKLFAINFFLSQLDLFVYLFRLIRSEKISAIRAPSPLYTGLFALLLARLSGVPLVIRVGANYDELREFTGKPVEPRLMRNRQIEKLVERFVLRRADLVAGANQNNLDFALANGARPDRSTLFRYGNLLDPRHFVDPAQRRLDPKLLEELGLKEEPFIVTIGRLEDTAAVKHPDDVVRVLKILADVKVRTKCVIVGDGRLRSRVEELAQELGVREQLVMAGNRNQEWLADVLPRAAVHVCPHAGRALSEAALAAVPTVAYDIDWQRELIETDKTGILVDYRDVGAMAAATKRLLEDPETATRLGTNLRVKALEMLDPKALDEHERGEYRQLLGG